MKKLSFLFIALLCAVIAQAQDIFVEAESFKDRGGWVVDPQFADQMGSPYLMAHGHGIKVKDAVTTINVEKAGTYYAWVRTYNWNSPWDKNQTPGTFNLLVNGKEVGSAPMGTIDHWGWQLAGKVDLHAGESTVSLQDLTGFNGRCDAVYFTTKKNAKLPDGGKELVDFRRKATGTVNPIDGGKYDFVVAGGGVAGISAAVAAARMGLKVLLVHNRPVLGGNNSPEVNIVISGRVKFGGYPNVGVVISEMGNIYKDPSLVKKIIDAEEGRIVVAYDVTASDVEMKGSKIIAVIGTDNNTGKRYRYEAKLFADCTGDANLGYLAGADWTMGREVRTDYGEDLAPEVPSKLSYGSTVKWNAKKGKKPVAFPDLPWAVQFTEATAQKVMGFKWQWEAGFYKDQIKDAEQIRDYWFRIIYGNWAYLKNHSSVKDDYANADFNMVSYILGKRESRRMLGDYIFTQKDVEGGWKNLPDTAVVCTYSLDQHFPDPENTAWFPGEEFKSTQKHNYNPMGVSRNVLPAEKVNEPYMMPLRSLYSRNIDNLFMAGRHASMTRITLTSARVQGSTGLMGEVVGIAAALCKKFDCTPRELYTNHLDAFREAMTKGIDQKFKVIYDPDSKFFKNWRNQGR